MGEAIKELGWKRSDVVLSTKIFWVNLAECLHCYIVGDCRCSSVISLLDSAVTGSRRRT